MSGTLDRAMILMHLEIIWTQLVTGSVTKKDLPRMADWTLDAIHLIEGEGGKPDGDPEGGGEAEGGSEMSR